VKSEQISESQGNQVLLVQNDVVSKKPILSTRSLVMIIGVIGFFTLGFATAAYFGLFQDVNFIQNTGHLQNQPSGTEAAKFPNSDSIISQNTSYNSYENCLAYGSGESITVMCPTLNGFVYDAILGMPRDLAQKFSDTVLSIRAVSLTENLDGSVTLHYQNSYYNTNFFVS
jgi:hypothetical protein